MYSNKCIYKSIQRKYTNLFFYYYYYCYYFFFFSPSSWMPEEQDRIQQYAHFKQHMAVPNRKPQPDMPGSLYQPHGQHPHESTQLLGTPTISSWSTERYPWNYVEARGRENAPSPPARTLHLGYHRRQPLCQMENDSKNEVIADTKVMTPTPG